MDMSMTSTATPMTGKSMASMTSMENVVMATSSSPAATSTAAMVMGGMGGMGMRLGDACKISVRWEQELQVSMVLTFTGLDAVELVHH